MQYGNLQQGLVSSKVTLFPLARVSHGKTSPGMHSWGIHRTWIRSSNDPGCCYWTLLRTLHMPDDDTVSLVLLREAATWEHCIRVLMKD